MILASVIILTIFGVNYLHDPLRPKDYTYEPINGSLFLSFIGMSVYAYEGVGIILPVMDTCNDKKNYPKLVAFVFIFLCALYIFIGGFNYYVYSKDVAVLVTSNLPSTNVFVQIVLLLYVVNLLVTYPLVIHPANMVIESYLFKSFIHKSKKRQWLKNLYRSIMVAFTIWVGLTLMETLDKLMSVIGALCCTPIAFTLPATFHLKLVARTRCEKAVDIAIIGMSFLVMGFCTIYTLITWNSGGGEETRTPELIVYNWITGSDSPM